MRNLEDINRIVVKVGTSVLSNIDGTLKEHIIQNLTDVLAKLQKSGKQIAIVTCGAISAGITKLRLRNYPTEMKDKQAAAAVGQSLLMGIYDKYFGRYNIPVAQLLLTKYTVQRDDTLGNATNSMNALFKHGVIPIVNENDAIITDEIKLGDNDNLAAYVANMINADLLVFLTNVDGLYDQDPRISSAKIIPEVTTITSQIKATAGGSTNPRSTGGMASKLAAAVVASTTNTKSIIMNGNNPSLILDALNGARVGTYFDLKGARYS